MEEVHQVAYLTMRGWVLVGSEWMKEGFEYEYKTQRGCGCHYESHTRACFPLEAAYEEQREKDEQAVRDNP